MGSYSVPHVPPDVHPCMVNIIPIIDIDLVNLFSYPSYCYSHTLGFINFVFWYCCFPIVYVFIYMRLGSVIFWLAIQDMIVLLGL